MADELQDVWTFECPESVQLAAAQALQNYGIVMPRGEPTETSANTNGCFGVPIDCSGQQTISYSYSAGDHDYTFQLPRVFVECVQFLKEHTDQEGLFRKAGSVSRQKALRASLENGGNIPADSNVHDVASVLKQYLRMLPDPLLTNHLSPVFESCVTLLPERDQTNCLVVACLLLPTAHLQCLCVLLELLKKVCENKGDSRMSANSLAVVMAPNLLDTQKNGHTFVASGNPLLVQTAIIQSLIENSDLIGRVPSEVGVASESYKSDLGMQATRSLEDMIEEERVLPDRYNKKKKKHRTSSISGLVLGLGSRLKQRGTAIFSGESSNSTSKKGTSIKRKGGSHEELLRTEGSKVIPCPLSNMEDIRRSIRTRVSSSALKSKPRPLVARQRPIISQPIIFNPSLIPNVDFSDQTHSNEPPVFTSNGETNDQTTEVSLKAVNEVGSNLKNLKRSASEPDVMSLPLFPLDASSSETNKRIRIEQPATKCVEKFTSSRSDFSLTGVVSHTPEYKLTFAPPTPSMPLSRGDSIGSPQKVNGEGTRFTFSVPTPHDPLKSKLQSNKLKDDIVIHKTRANFVLSPTPSRMDRSSLSGSCPRSPLCSELDQAFIRTPYPAIESPNLLDKINSEMVQRSSCSSEHLSTWYGNCTPLASPNVRRESIQHVNESYKKAVLGSNAFATRFQRSRNVLVAPKVVEQPKAMAICGKPSNELSVEESSVSETLNMPCPPMSLDFDCSSNIVDSATVSTMSLASATLSGESNILSTKLDPFSKDLPNDCNCAVATSSKTDGDKIHSSVSRSKSKSKNKDTVTPKSKTSITSPSSKKRYTVKSPAARQGTTMKVTSSAHLTRRRYAYSATLGIGDTLVQPRTQCRQKVMSPSRSVQTNCSPASISASLGITGLNKDGLRRTSRRKNYPPRKIEQKSQMVVGKTLSDSSIEGSQRPEQNQLCDSIHASDRKDTSLIDSIEGVKGWTSTKFKVTSSNCLSPDSPAPALLRILESNVAQSLKKEAASRCSTSPTPSTYTKSLSSSPQKQHKVVRSMSSIKHSRQGQSATMSVGGSVAMDTRLDSAGGKQKARQTPFKKGLRSPWFQKSTQNRAYKSALLDGDSLNRRAELYVVKNGSPSPSNKANVPGKCLPSSLQKMNSQSSRLSTDKENYPREKLPVYTCRPSKSQGNVEVKEWVL